MIGTYILQDAKGWNVAQFGSEGSARAYMRATPQKLTLWVRVGATMMNLGGK